MRPSGIHLILLTLIAAAVAWPATGHARIATIVQRYVTVIDEERRPVLGLTEEDFALRDGGIRQHVIDVARADAPLTVVVVPLGFDATEQPAVAAALTTAGQMLKSADGRHVFTPFHIEAGASRPVVDVLVDASLQLQSVPTDRRVVLAMLRRRTGDGAVAQSARLNDAVLQSRAALWTIEVGPKQSTALDNALNEATALGGALREGVTAGSAMTSAVTRIVQLLTMQYVVSYEWPDPVLSQLNITIRHERGVVLVPAWQRY